MNKVKPIEGASHPLPWKWIENLFGDGSIEDATGATVGYIEGCKEDVGRFIVDAVNQAGAS